VSEGEFTTTYTVLAAVAAVDPLVFGNVSVGMVAGAVNTPWAEIVPQFGLQEAPVGASPFGKSVVSPVTGCITAQVGAGFTGGAFRKEAVN
jgi:hypothetical protein